MTSLIPDSTLGRKESVEPGVRAPLLTCPWPSVVPSWPGLHLLKINVKGLGLISPEASSNILWCSLLASENLWGGWIHKKCYQSKPYEEHFNMEGGMEKGGQRGEWERQRETEWICNLTTLNEWGKSVIFGGVIVRGCLVQFLGINLTAKCQQTGHVGSACRGQAYNILTHVSTVHGSGFQQVEAGCSFTPLIKGWWVIKGVCVVSTCQVHFGTSTPEVLGGSPEWPSDTRQSLLIVSMNLIWENYWSLFYQVGEHNNPFQEGSPAHGECDRWKLIVLCKSRGGRSILRPTQTNLG